jgi:hypothetical protein
MNRLSRTPIQNFKNIGTKVVKVLKKIINYALIIYLNIFNLNKDNTFK